MIRQETTAWIGAVVVSLGLHVALFLNSGARLGNPEAPARESYRATRVTFSSEAPADATVPVPEPQPQKPEREEVPTSPVPEPEPEREAERVPEPVPEPAPEPPEETPPLAQAVATPPTASSSAAPPPSAAKGANSPDEMQLTERDKEAYLARLLAHIERHKRYPRVARRRGLEGRVEVSFRLLGAGNIEGLKAEGTLGPLRRAAEAAVRDSVPLPVPPEGMQLPLEVRFGMVFSLR